MVSTTKLILGVAILSMGIAGAISMGFTLQEIEEHEEWLEGYQKDKELLETMGADTFHVEMEIKETEDEIKDLRNRLQICPIFILIFFAFGAFFLYKFRYEKKLEAQAGLSPSPGHAQNAQTQHYIQYPPTQPPRYPPRY